MNRRILHSLPIVIACIALASGSHEPVAPMVMAFVALASALVKVRMPLDIATQRLAMVVVIVLTIVGIRASGMSMRGPYLGALGYGIALAPLVVVALRSWIARAEWGPRFDLSCALVSLIATAAARPGLPYLALFLAFVVATIAVRRSDDPYRLPIAEQSPRTRRIAGALVVSAILTGVFVTFAAQIAYVRIQRRFQHAFQTAYEENVGLSDTVRLGNMTGLLTSNAVVLRVSGAPIDRVRGVVLDEYGGGRWTRANTEPLGLLEVSRTRPTGPDVVEVRHIDPDRGHIFLPLDARGISTERGAINGDSMGTATAVSGAANPIVWFRTGPRDQLTVAAPRAEDLLMPHRLRPKLTKIADEWTRDSHTPEQALAAIESRLARDYTYSLVHDAPPSVDPVLDFLTVSKRGHCEYFASAFALLARSIGIPTRMVLGYRVAERNPYWHSYVVRKKNAHAWVEVYLAGKGWTTIDPTPMTELPQDVPHDERSTSAAIEAISIAWEKTEGWLAKRSVFELGATAVLGVVVFALQRWRRARKVGSHMGEDGLGFAPTPEAFVRLEGALALRGLGRERSESIERWAARIAIPELADVLQRYARARYGDVTMDGLDDALNSAMHLVPKGARTKAHPRA